MGVSHRSCSLWATQPGLVRTPPCGTVLTKAGRGLSPMTGSTIVTWTNGWSSVVLVTTCPTGRMVTFGLMWVWWLSRHMNMQMQHDGACGKRALCVPQDFQHTCTVSYNAHTEMLANKNHVTCESTHSTPPKETLPNSNHSLIRNIHVQYSNRDKPRGNHPNRNFTDTSRSTTHTVIQ